MDSTLSIGLNRLNWLSKNLDELFLPAEEKIHLMSDFLDQIASLITYRIEEPINEISHFEILEFPDDSIDLKQFVDEIRQQMVVKAEKLNSLSSQIESAVLHVIKMFFDKLGYTSKPFEHKIGNIGISLNRMSEIRMKFCRFDATFNNTKTSNTNVCTKLIEIEESNSIDTSTIQRMGAIQ